MKVSIEINFNALKRAGKKAKRTGAAVSIALLLAGGSCAAADQPQLPHVSVSVKSEA